MKAVVTRGKPEYSIDILKTDKENGLMQLSGSVVCPEGEPSIFVTGCEKSKCYITGNRFDIFFELEDNMTPIVDISTNAFQVELHLKANESKIVNTNPLSYIKQSIKSKKAINILDKNYRDMLKHTISNINDNEIYDIRYAYQSYLSKLPKLKLSEAIEEINHFPYKPLISIIMPVYNVKKEWFERCIESIRTQVYENWELCIADDNSTLEYIPDYLAELSNLDSRIKVVMRGGNGHIVRATNSALQLATGEFCALMDDDDILTQDALYEVVKLLNYHPDADLIYSDEDKLETDNSLTYPHFKGVWSPELLYSSNYISHLGVYRTEILKGIGGFNVGFEGSQDYDMVLRFTEYTNRIYHIPKVLYNWRIVHGSAAQDNEQKSYTSEAGIKALIDSLKRRGINFDRVDYIDRIGMYDVKLKPIDPTNVKFTIFVTGKGDITTKIPNAQIISLKEISGSALNKVYSSITGDYVIFWDRSVEANDANDIYTMCQWASLPGVGAVGPKLYDLNVCYSAGIALNPKTVRCHIGLGEMNTDGYFGKYTVTTNVSAVSAKMLVMTRENFDKIAPFDDNIKECISSEIGLMLMSKWQRNISCSIRMQIKQPISTAIDHDELTYMQKRWGMNLVDRYYPSVFSDKGNYHIVYK